MRDQISQSIPSICTLSAQDTSQVRAEYKQWEEEDYWEEQGQLTSGWHHISVSLTASAKSDANPHQPSISNRRFPFRVPILCYYHIVKYGADTETVELVIMDLSLRLCGWPYGGVICF